MTGDSCAPRLGRRPPPLVARRTEDEAVGARRCGAAPADVATVTFVVSSSPSPLISAALGPAFSMPSCASPPSSSSLLFGSLCRERSDRLNGCDAREPTTRLRATDTFASVLGLLLLLLPLLLLLLLLSLVVVFLLLLLLLLVGAASRAAHAFSAVEEDAATTGAGAVGCAGVALTAGGAETDVSGEVVSAFAGAFSVVESDAVKELLSGTGVELLLLFGLRCDGATALGVRFSASSVGGGGAAAGVAATAVVVVAADNCDDAPDAAVEAVAAVAPVDGSACATGVGAVLLLLLLFTPFGLPACELLAITAEFVCERVAAVWEFSCERRACTGKR